jgi:hypothetical protein
MSRAKWLLAGATLALVLITLWAVRESGERTGYVAHQEKLFPQLPAQAGVARRIEIHSAGRTVTLRGAGGDWAVVEKHDFPADPAKVRALLEGLAELTLVEPRTADPARHAALDLDPPDAPSARGVLVRVLGEGDAELAAVVLGKARVSAGQGPREMFVRRPNENQTWLASGAVDVLRTPPLWLRAEAFDLPQARVREVRIQHPGAAPLALVRAKADEAFRLEAPLPKGRTPRASTVNAAAYGLQHLPLQDVYQPDEVTADWSQATAVDFVTFDGLVVTARVVTMNGTPYLRLSAALADDATEQQRESGAGEAERINHDCDGWVYVVPPHTVVTFTPKLDDLLEPLPPPAGAEPPGPRGPRMPGMMPGRPPGM